MGCVPRTPHPRSAVRNTCRRRSHQRLGNRVNIGTRPHRKLAAGCCGEAAVNPIDVNGTLEVQPALRNSSRHFNVWAWWAGVM